MTPQGIELPQGVPERLSTPGAHGLPAKHSFRTGLSLVLVLLLSGLYMGRELKRGWVPGDEGTLAESADRVLHGELPHRDYHEGYTGGLSYLNAAAFRLFGTNLASMRYMLFLFFLAWVPAVYYVASRFVSPLAASAVTLLAVAWGPPNYAAAMPSWYNLFFATFGLAALLRYTEAQSDRWLLVAGFCGGISLLFKQLGLYFIAGTLLFLLFREQMAPRTVPADRRESIWYRGFLLTSVLLYEALLFGLLRKLANAATYLYYWVPNLAVGATIVWEEFQVAPNCSRRFSFFLRELALFGIGVAAPIAVFLVPYCLTGSLSPFIVVLGVGLLVRWSALNRLNCTQRQRLFVTLSVTAACGLLQFPFRNIYFCYIAPLVLLCATAVVSLMEKPPRLAVSGMMSFCFLYAVLELTPGFVYHLAYEYAPDTQTVRLSLPRAGGLRVTAESASEYEELDSLIRQHARGEYIFAKPDSPQVYFLSGFRDPTGIFYDFYEDASGRTQRALAAIELHNVNLVVLNHHRGVDPIAEDLKTALEHEFPNRADAGGYEVRWKP